MLEANNEMKRRLVLPWTKEKVEGKRMFDLFYANGAFSVEAALVGVREVVGVEFSPERIECARFLAGTLEGKVDCSLNLMIGDVYGLSGLFSEPFDVVMALGRLYHVAPYVLTQIGGLTKEHLIVQTATFRPRGPRETTHPAPKALTVGSQQPEADKPKEAKSWRPGAAC